MIETQTVDLASWLTAVWDEEERRELQQTHIEFKGLEQVNHRGNPHVLARIAADRKILELHGRRSGYCKTCGDHWPCLTVCLLASPYKGREGWQEAWGHE